MWVRGLVFLLVLTLAAHYGRPWELGWLRPDEAEDIAEDFLVRQGAELDNYTLIRATEHRRHGAWEGLEGGTLDGGDPAVGYVLRYFVKGNVDSWTVGVSPSGQIYRVAREQLEDEPGDELDELSASALTRSKLATDLGLPVGRLILVRDSLRVQPQRNDWEFDFAVISSAQESDTAESGAIQLRAELSGNVITGLRAIPPPRVDKPPILPQRAETNRVLGFAFILIGVFIIWQFHKTPLASTAAGRWGGIAFVLILLVRGLTFVQSVLLMPADVPYSGYLARIGLSAVVDALQVALLMGLIVATGDSAMGDHLSRSTTLTRRGREIRSWPHAWGNGARWALGAAAIIVVVEIIALRMLGPVGLYSKLPPIIAGSLSSPLPALALPAQLTYDVIWDEALFRLWLFPFTLLFFRSWMGVLVSAGIVTYWTGFNPSQILEPGCLAYLWWNIVAAFLVVRSGIMAAVLFHFFALTGLAAITVFWIGFDTWSAGILLGLLVAVIAAIGWREEWDSRSWSPTETATDSAARGS